MGSGMGFLTTFKWVDSGKEERRKRRRMNALTQDIELRVTHSIVLVYHSLHLLHCTYYHVHRKTKAQAYIITHLHRVKHKYQSRLHLRLGPSTTL